jgi:Amidohydrolase ring-opening protein (Amido_AtzD_TrzD)
MGKTRPSFRSGKALASTPPVPRSADQPWSIASIERCPFFVCPTLSLLIKSLQRKSLPRVPLAGIFAGAPDKERLDRMAIRTFDFDLHVPSTLHDARDAEGVLAISQGGCCSSSRFSSALRGTAADTFGRIQPTAVLEVAVCVVRGLTHRGSGVEHPTTQAESTNGHRHTMLDDTDINAQRHVRGAVGAIVAGVVGDTLIFVSGGTEHQGPYGGSLIAVFGRRALGV